MTQMFDRLFLAVDDTRDGIPRDPGLWERFSLQFGRQTTVAHTFSEAELVQTDQMWND
jgi:hypothetical protein